MLACGFLSSCGMRAPEHTGSVVAACRLSCPTACGILVPRPGIEPASPALEGGFLTTGPPGKSPHPHFIIDFALEVHIETNDIHKCIHLFIHLGIN